MNSKVRIGFSTTNSLLSRGIRWLTKSRVSHSFIIYWDPMWGRDMVLESHEYGIRIIPLSKFCKKNKIIYIFELKPNGSKLDYALKIQQMGDRLGEAYDFGGLVGFLWVLLGRWLGKKVKNPLQSSKSMFCSEMISNFLISIGCFTNKELTPESTSPEDLLRLLESSKR